MVTATAGDLRDVVAGCRACPRMCAGSAVLERFERRTWLFVGEAPGRLGAGRTGVAFEGDESGRRFERLLTVAGLRREEVFVTNAVLCLPLDAGGRNRTPLASEVRNCAAHLAETIRQVEPRLVVAMGGTAVRATNALGAHGAALPGLVGRAVDWNERLLTAVYHPGRQAELHRAWHEQENDWARLRALTGSGA